MKNREENIVKFIQELEDIEELKDIQQTAPNLAIYTLVEERLKELHEEGQKCH